MSTDTELDSTANHNDPIGNAEEIRCDMEPATSSIVEGIGDEVLLTFLLGGGAVVLVLAWYSTNLTSSQSRLTSVQVHRRGVVLNRIIDSSTTDTRSSQQTRGDVPESESVEDTLSEPVEATVNGSVEETLSGSVGASVEAAPSEYFDETISEENLSHLSLPTEQSINTESGNHSSVLEAAEGTEISAENHSDSEPLHPPVSQTEGKEESPGVQTQEEFDDEPLPSESNVNNDTSETEPTTEDTSDSIQIRLKFLDDNEKTVKARKSDTVALFKRANFAEELAENRLIRLIFNGAVLQDERTLESCNITENSAVHALISDTNTTNSSQPAHSEQQVFNAGIFMVPMFTIILTMIWYLRFRFAQYFTLISTLSLACITVVFLACLVAQRRPARPQNTVREYGINITAG